MKSLIIGESCIDEYVYGSCDRVCPEASALCFTRLNKKKTSPGMAGNVYRNMLAINQSADIDLITSQSKIIKRRFIDQKYNTIVFREDINDKCEPIDINRYNFSKYDCIIFSDYCKGFLSVSDILNICKLKKEKCITFLDTKKVLCTDLMNSIDFIKINEQEFKQNVIQKNIFHRKCSLIVTKGENGATLYKNNRTQDFSTKKVLLRDVCGAGDTFLAAMATFYVRTQNIEGAIIFANKCASKVVSKFGVTTI